ncbi:MAG: bifunctional enoyl-CoA hydratase/phosphate acetyltransferase [Rhodospirillales bacterium]|nr:bifunctional enoyl-CoA hydratase/phosphate acetyltransferase [Rhodospirillales bacterium]
MLSDHPFEVPHDLIEKAKRLPAVSMAVAGADHPVALESAKQATDAGLIIPTLVGDKSDIERIAKDLGWDITGIRVVNSKPEQHAADAAVQLASKNEVQSLMKGQLHTDSIMRAVVQRDAGLRTDRRISHVFHMTAPGSDKVLMISDASVNVAPNEETLLHIVQNSVDLAHALGYELPKVAMLSGSESVIDSMPSTILARKIVERANSGEVEGADVDGPFAFDNAVSPEAAKLKGISGPVAGQADILVTPNIEMANGLFKMLVYFRSALAAGVVLGAKVPVVLTSRADPPEARFAACAIAQLRAAHDA